MTTTAPTDDQSERKRYVLTRHAFGDHPELPISPDEYHSVSAALRCMQESLEIEERFDQVLRNYFELEQELLTLTLSSAVYTETSWSSYIDMMQHIARRIANLLTTTKAYVDQTPRAMHTLFGDGSVHFRIVKDYLSEQYDSCLGYRVCEALRNHVQHHGLAVHGISAPISWEDRKAGSRVRSHYLTPMLNVDELRKNRDFHKKVLAELVTLGARHDLKTFIREYISGLGRAHTKVRELIQGDAVEWDATIRGLIDRFLADPKSAGNAIGVAAMQVDQQRLLQAGTLVYVSNNMSDRRAGLTAKNRNPTHFDRMVITSEIHQAIK